MKKCYQKGFGLLEVVVSSMILVLVVGAVVALGMASVRGSSTASDKTAAYNLVQECLETIRAQRNTAWLDTSENWYDHFLIDTRTNIIDSSNFQISNKCGNVNSGGTQPVDYSRSISVSDVDWYGLANAPTYNNGTVIPQDKIKKVTVTVRWMADNGTNRTITGSTYLSDWKTLN